VGGAEGVKMREGEEISDFGLRISDWKKSKIQDTGYRILGTGCWIQEKEKYREGKVWGGFYISNFIHVLRITPYVLRRLGRAGWFIFNSYFIIIFLEES
jgi:hypothetical protein